MVYEASVNSRPPTRKVINTAMVPRMAGPPVRYCRLGCGESQVNESGVRWANARHEGPCLSVGGRGPSTALAARPATGATTRTTGAAGTATFLHFLELLLLILGENLTELGVHFLLKIRQLLL